MEEQNKNVPQNLPENQARRKTLKKLVIGASALAGYSMLPEKWTKPIVEQIILPAHAQTSGTTLLVNPLTLTLLSGTQGTATVAVRIFGAVSPPIQNLAILLRVQGALRGNSAVIPPPSSSKGIVQEALASVGDFLISEAVAAETCSQLSQQVTSAQDGSFSADFELSCGPGITSVSATASLVTSSGTTAEGILFLPSDSNDAAATNSSPSTETTESLLSGYSFTNNSSGNLTVEWENPDRTDSVGPGESVQAPEGVDASSRIWVTGTNYMFTCPNVSTCFSGTYGGEMSLVINDCGGEAVINDCSASPAQSAQASALASSRNYAW